MTDKPDRPDPGVALGDTAVAATAPSQDGDSDAPFDSREPAAAPRMRLVHTGDALGRYTLDEQVGEGGMATVFRARDRDLRREVAIKVLFPHLARRDDVVRRFHREARAAAGLEHPNILRIYDVGGASGGDPPFIVMELIRGHSLSAEVEARGPILSEVVACIGALLADALAAAHAAGIVHRDIKPANVMVGPGGRLLLADFGVARLETEDSLVTKTGAVLGTPAYMSPEQATGEVSTHKSDLYSLGATLYQLATGSLPYSGSPAKVLAAIATGAYVPAVRRRASVGADLSRAIDRMMSIDAVARPADAATVAAELRAIAATGGLGDPVDELASYFADQDAFLRARTPTVVTALVHAAQRAVDESKLPRAMALADRASALAPDDPTVTALIQTVTEGGRASSRRRMLALGLGVAVVAGGAYAGVRALGHGGGAPADASVVAVAPGDAAAADALPADATVALAPDDAVAALSVADAGAPADGRPLLAPRDAGGRARDAGGAVTIGRDATTAAAEPDAAPPPPPPDAAAPPAEGSIVVGNDVWCVITLDGKPAGRLDSKTFTLSHVPAGAHHVRCEQADQKRAWEHDVDVPPGGVAHVSDVLLGKLTIRIGAVPGDVLIDGQHYARGEIAHLAHGSHRFDSSTADTQYLTISVDCTLTETPGESGRGRFGCTVAR